MTYKIFDAHSDIPDYVYFQRIKGRTKVLETEFDNFFGEFVKVRVAAVWTRPEKRNMALQYALEMINQLYKDVGESTKFAIVKNTKEMENALKNNKIALWIGMEGGEPLQESLDLLEVFHTLGLRVLTLTWNLRNAIGDGCTERTNGGLTNFGIEVVGKAEELGILVDLSHINEQGFWDVLDMTKTPLIASHSNARALCDHVRNLRDEQIKAIAERDGVIGVTAYPPFIHKTKPTLKGMIDHIKYMVDLVGYKHVGLGFDFTEYLAGWEGANVLENFKNEQDIPQLVKILTENFTEKEVKAITFENFRRVFKKVVG